MVSYLHSMAAEDRAHLHFNTAVREKFEFLNCLGFLEVESSPTLVRYRKDSVDVEVYHGRLSYEIAASISYVDVRYEFTDIVRAVDPKAAQSYCHAQTSTPDGVIDALKELASLMKRYGTIALRGDPLFFLELNKKREIWADDYWLNRLARQLRPKAEEAFRRGDYAVAVDFYGRIRECLSSAEMKKLIFAEERVRIINGAINRVK
jgi:hypothetical protein